MSKALHPTSVLLAGMLLLFGRAALAADAPNESSVPVPAGEAAAASPKQEAAARFNRAIKLYEDGDYALALAEFERVYELVPNYHVLYNIAQVSEQLGRYARALKVFQDYLAQGGDSLPPERRAEVQTELVNLTARTARIDVHVDHAGAEILLDGASVGLSPLTTSLTVDVGEHTLVAQADGFVSQTVTLSLAGGDQREASFNLVPVPKAVERTVVIERPTTRRAEPEPAHRKVWLGWAATGALAASAVVFEIVGANAASKLNQDVNTAPQTRAGLDADRSRAKTWLVTADILGGAAIVAGGVSLYFQLTPSQPNERAPAVSALKLRVAPGRVALSGAF